MTTQPVSADLVLQWTWGDRIRKIRRAARLSQRDFADALGMKSATIAAWEASESLEPPRGGVAAAKRIELMFPGVPAAWTLGLDDTPPNPPGSPSDSDTCRYPAIGLAGVLTLQDRAA